MLQWQCQSVSETVVQKETLYCTSRSGVITDVHLITKLISVIRLKSFQYIHQRPPHSCRSRLQPACFTSCVRLLNVLYCCVSCIKCNLDDCWGWCSCVVAVDCDIIRLYTATAMVDQGWRCTGAALATLCNSLNSRWECGRCMPSFDQPPWSLAIINPQSGWMHGCNEYKHW